MPDPRDGTFRRPSDAAPERLDRVLRTFRPDLSWNAVRDLVQRGKVSVGGCVVLDPGVPIAAGAEVVVAVQRPATAAAPAAAAALARQRIVLCDRHVVVVDKPAGVDTVPFAAKGHDRRTPLPPAVGAATSLDRQVAAALGAPVRVVHRLDRDTTGLLVFARTDEAEARLAHQLRRHTMHRRYLGIAHGDVPPGTIRSFLVDDRGDGRRGATTRTRLGKEAITHVDVVERVRGATLIACRLETGRTHQIRIHLAEAGHMLLGERAYTRDHRGPVLAAPRILLHAAELGFAHPDTDEPVRAQAPMPDDMQAVVAALR